MYTLDENLLDKVRAEETKNRKPATKGLIRAVIPGVEAQWIQPLTIRGKPGLRQDQADQQVGGGEDVSLHIHGSSMVVSATGAAAARRTPTIVQKDKSGEFSGTSTEHAGRRPTVPYLRQ